MYGDTKLLHAILCIYVLSNTTVARIYVSNFTLYDIMIELPFGIIYIRILKYIYKNKLEIRNKTNIDNIIIIIWHNIYSYLCIKCIIAK